ncbi:hypothetical protein D3C72_2497400 [compost metagenome]
MLSVMPSSRSMPAACLDIDVPAIADTPADRTSSLTPRSAASLRRSPSAIGLRQVLPVQMNKI